MKLKLTRHTEYSAETGVFDIHSFRYAIRQTMNPLGEIISSAHTGLIRIVMNDFPPMQFIRWAWGYKYLYDGVITKDTRDGLPQEIQFHKAGCMSLWLHYKADDAEPINITMDIAAEKLSLAGENISKEEK